MMSAMPIIMFAGAAMLVVVMVALAFSGPSTAKAQARRINALRDRHSNSTGAIVEAQMRRIQSARNTKMDNLAARFLPKPALLKKRLDMTGKTWSPGRYLGACLMIGTIVMAGLLIKGAPVLLSIFVGFFLGLVIPHIVVGMTIKKRVTRFTKNFPDAIELLVRGLRSGLPITETLGVVASEIPGPVGVEFRSVSDKMKIGRTMDVALQETADRLGTPEFQFFVITLQIQRETGGNLAETLSNLADVLRKRSQMRLKIKAMSSESKASAYIIGALPFIVFFMILQINYSYMAAFFTDPRLIGTGLGGMVWMGIGAFIMRQMINFEI
jgi:tight adherence protein B